jgi:rubrerythrin
MNWLAYFKQNRRERMPIPWENRIELEPHLRAPLIRSLQRFQVGEQGDGKHLKMGAAATGDPEYAETIALFIKEEQEHARLLAGLLRGMGARLLKWHWSDLCFILLRRLLKLKLELMVLLVAEMIAKRYYRALYEGTHDPVLKAVFTQILRDELGHVAFHCDYLNNAFKPLPSPARFFILLAWQLFFNSVCLVVMWDHRALLKAVGVSPVAFWCDCGQIFHETAHLIFASRSQPELKPLA